MTQNNQLTFEERMRLDRAPLPLKIYKGMGGKFGAMRMMFKRPWQNDPDRKQDGVIFIEMAPAIGKNQYDWENQKVKFAIGINDIGHIIDFFNTPSRYIEQEDNNKIKVQVYHDTNAGTANAGKDIKILSISKTKGQDNYIFQIAQKVNGGKFKNTSTTLSNSEAAVMIELLKAAVPAMLCWTGIGLEE